MAAKNRRVDNELPQASHLHDSPVENGASQGSLAGIERRIHPRYPVDCAAAISPLTGAEPIHGRLIDLGLGGCSVAIKRPYRAGILVRVEVQFQLRGMTFRLFGVIAGSRGTTSFAVRFVDMPARRRAELAEVITEIAALRPVNADKSSSAALPVSADADSPAQPSAVSVMNRPSSTPQPSRILPAAPADRRSHSRHQVDSTANLLLVKTGITMSGRIMNLSRGGCRIRTEEPFNVGIYVRIETEFYLHGLPFRLVGVSQAILDKNTIGIRFLDMSDRKRKQLTELISELPEIEPYRPQSREKPEARVQNR
jgi:c-di-GMP-binding flagellar brake protein YcgR